jgi:hypothetical protein
MLISYLRASLGKSSDVASLALTNEDMVLYMNVVLTRDFPQILSLDLIPNEAVYPLVLLTKKEIYFTLATNSASDVSMEAEGASLSKSDRFKHYMTLIAKVDEEYDKFIEDGGAGGVGNTLTAYDVLLPDRFYTPRNTLLAPDPKIVLAVDAVRATEADLSWTAPVTHFFSNRVYVHTAQIWDEYALIGSELNKEAQLVATLLNAKQHNLRLTGLLPNTLYHVLLLVTLTNGNRGYAETTFTTEAGV